MERAELEGWDSLIANAGSGAPAKQEAAKAEVMKKVVFSLVNLGNDLNGIQRVTGRRLEDLAISINNFSESSAKLYLVNTWLTVVIALATIANVVVAIVK